MPKWKRYLKTGLMKNTKICDAISSMKITSTNAYGEHIELSFPRKDFDIYLDLLELQAWNNLRSNTKQRFGPWWKGVQQHIRRLNTISILTQKYENT